MITLFLLLRYLAGPMLASAILVMVAIMFLHSAANFAKEGVGVMGYVIALFTSGFTQGTPPPEARGWIASLPQIGLIMLFIAMIASLFYPGSKIFLHVVAVMAIAATFWYVRMIFTGVQLEILCLPVLPVWFTYYAICLFWRGLFWRGPSLSNSLLPAP